MKNKRCVGTTSNQLQKPSDSEKQLLTMKNLKICQNLKMVKTENFYKLGQKFCTHSPHFWEVKPEQTEVMAHG